MVQLEDAGPGDEQKIDPKGRQRLAGWHGCPVTASWLTLARGTGEAMAASLAVMRRPE